MNGSPPETRDRNWFTMDLAEVLEALGTATGGLSDEEAASRLAHYGPNTLPRRKPPGLVDSLLKGGFRRSQNIAYMPYCEGCQGCVSVRVLVDKFELSRSMRRVKVTLG